MVPALSLQMHFPGAAEKKNLQRQRHVPCPAGGELPGAENPNQILSQEEKIPIKCGFSLGDQVECNLCWLILLRLQNEGKTPQQTLVLAERRQELKMNICIPNSFLWQPCGLELLPSLGFPPGSRNKQIFPIYPHICECLSGSVLIPILIWIQAGDKTV